MLKPLTSVAEMTRVEQALATFYRWERSTYGLEQTETDGLTEYVAFVQQHAPRGSVVLEFGAGTWRSPLMLHHAGFRVVGCDVFSEADLAAFRERIGDAAQLLTYDGHRIPLPDASVDVVTSRNVFEHILHVDSMLAELDRVLAPGGVFVLVGPNLGGPLKAIRALAQLLSGADRYWQYESTWQAVVGLVRILAWDLKVRTTQQPRFLLIEPRMRDGKIHFQDSDDDAVHLCHPLSFRKWFTARGYEVVRFNSFGLHWRAGAVWNRLCPTLATWNEFVFRKPIRC
jgi:SAM-dependent methyltransferase